MTTPPPRTMPTKFAYQEQTIKRLQQELDEAHTQAKNLRKQRVESDDVAQKWMEMHDKAKTEMDAIRKAMRGYPDSDLVSLAETLVASNKAHEHLQEWAQRAYVRLSGLADVVSAEDEIELWALLADAPKTVKGGE